MFRENLLKSNTEFLFWYISPSYLISLHAALYLSLSECGARSLLRGVNP